MCLLFIAALFYVYVSFIYFHSTTIVGIYWLFNLPLYYSFIMYLSIIIFYYFTFLFNPYHL